MAASTTRHPRHGQQHQNIGGVHHNTQLEDGFQEILTFKGHRLQLRGFNIVDSLEDPRRQTKFSQYQHYISWDVKQILLWGFDPYDPNAKMNIVNQVKFSNQPNYICAIVHVNKMKVFLAAALDMSFKIFDNHLNLLESIHHEERAILQLEYDGQRELIFSSGATGISAWRLYRNTALDKAHIMEKLYSFSGCDTWITNMIYQPQFNRIFAIKESTVQVLSTTRRAVVTTLENVHEAPINVVCWYERNQFYLTGCSRGEIKCWTSNHTQSEGKKGNNGHSHNLHSFGHSHQMHQHGGGGAVQNDKNYALLHTFKGHIKGVTAIHLHPVSGLAISAGLDGFMKVLNLEALNELFSIQVGAGIIGMRIVKLPNNHHGCLVSLTDATIQLWKITSVCNFFAVASSKIAKVDVFENLEAELEYHYRMRKPDTREIKKAELSVIEHLISVNSGGKGDEAKKDINKKDQPSTESKKEEVDAKNIKLSTDQFEYMTSGGLLSDKIIVTQSNQDLRAFTHKGVLLGRLEPEHLMDGIKALCVSVYQKLLFCLCEGSRVRVFDLKRFNFPLLYEFSLRNPSVPSYKASTLLDLINKRNPKQAAAEAAFNKAHNINDADSSQELAHGSSATEADAEKKDSVDDGDESKKEEESEEVEGDIGVCCTLIDVAPASILRAPKFAATVDPSLGQHHVPSKYDVRGEKVGHYIESFLLLGLSTGSIVFLDVLNKFEVIMSFQAINGIVMDLKYRRRHRELIMYGKDYSQIFTSIKIWKMPEMELIGEYSEMRNICSFAVSHSLNFFALGTIDGEIRLFSNHTEDKVIREIQTAGEGHESQISSICFIDDLRVFSSSSTDGKVKFWDFEKRLIRSIQLNIPTCAVIANGGIGDIVMAQNHYLLTIPKRIWNEDDVLGQVKLLAQAEEMSFTVSPLRLEDPNAVQLNETNANDNQSTGEKDSQNGSNPNHPPETPDDASRKGGDGSRRMSSQDRRSSRRFSKLSNQVSQSTIRKLSLNRKSSSVRGLSSANSVASIRSEDDTTVTSNFRQPGQVSFEELEKEILLPVLKSKQYQFIDRDGSRSPPRRYQPHVTNTEEVFVRSQDISLAQQSIDMTASIFPSESIQLEMKRYEDTQYGNQMEDERRQHDVIDVLHPRFLVHKKAPARIVQLEDIQEHVNRYMNLAGMNPLGRNTMRKTNVNTTIEKPVMAAEVPSKSNPHFGLSPRARITLISSRPQTSQSTQGSKESQNSEYTMDKIQDDEFLVQKAREKLIVDLSLGMQVSNEYKQQRAALNQERQQRMTTMQQRSTLITKENLISPPKKDKEKEMEQKPEKVIKRGRRNMIRILDDDQMYSDNTTPNTTGPNNTAVNTASNSVETSRISSPEPDDRKPLVLPPFSIENDVHSSPFSPAYSNLVIPSTAGQEEDGVMSGMQSSQSSRQDSAASRQELGSSQSRRKPLKPTFIPPPINVNV